MSQPINRTNKSRYILPFILVTLCFALWGFANDITNPMVKAFSKIFRMSVTDGTLVQVAFYGGYFAMALPAALFIKKFSYKAGMLMGLGLYAIGSFLFFPAKLTGSYYPFLIAYFIITCGLSFLETSANPYILTLGGRENATRRLNLAQAFNPIGSLLGMYVAMNFIQCRLNPMDSAARSKLEPAAFETMKQTDLGVLITPYLIIGLIIVGLMIAFFLVPIPQSDEPREHSSLGVGLRALWQHKPYREGLFAQFFYVGAQIMCWTFIIQYGTKLFMDRGMDELSAEVISQKYNIAAMAFFCASRFICTGLLSYIKPAKLLSLLSIVAFILCAGVCFLPGLSGLYALVGVSACMSLMFPTIYGLSMEKLESNVQFGSAGMIMAILGGSVLPPVQARIIDCGTLFGYSAVHLSFVVPCICFAVVSAFALRQLKR